MEDWTEILHTYIHSKKIEKKLKEGLLKRELLLEKIIQLNEIAKQKSLIFHKFKKQNHPSLSFIEQEVLSTQHELTLRRQDLLELDQIIDSYEEELIEKNTKNVIQVLTSYNSEFRSHQVKISNQNQLIHTLKKEYGCCSQLAEILNSNIESKEISRFRLLTKPWIDLRIAKNIKKAADTIEKIISELDDSDLKAFLLIIQKEANKKWNKELYQNTYRDIREKCEVYLRRLRTQLLNAQAALVTYENEVELWIEKHASIS